MWKWMSAPQNQHLQQPESSILKDNIFSLHMFIYMEGIRKSLLFGHPDQVGRGPLLGPPLLLAWPNQFVNILWLCPWSVLKWLYWRGEIICYLHFSCIDFWNYWPCDGAPRAVCQIRDHQVGAILQYCNTVVMVQFCNTTAAHRINTVAIHSSNREILQYCNTVEMVQFCNTTATQRFNAILQYCCYTQ